MISADGVGFGVGAVVVGDGDVVTTCRMVGVDDGGGGSAAV